MTDFILCTRLTLMGKGILPVAILLFSLSPLLTAEDSWVALDGVFQIYSQEGSYDSSADKTSESAYGYELRGMWLSPYRVGLYGSFGMFMPQKLTTYNKDGSKDTLTLSTMDDRQGYSFMLGAGGMIQPTEMLDAYLGLGINWTSLTYSRELSPTQTFTYHSDRIGFGADLGIKLNVMDSLSCILGSYILTYPSVTEKISQSGDSETYHTSVLSLDVRPYLGLGMRF